MDKVTTEPVNLDAAAVFSEWTIRRTCGELDPGPGIFLRYELLCRGRPIVGFLPTYEDLTMDSLPHLIAVIEKILPEVLSNSLALRLREVQDVEYARGIADAFDETSG